MSINIFIIDDHPTIRHLLQKFLNRFSDLTVCGVAASGQDALEQLPKLNVDLVLVDASLPDIHGIDLIEELIMWRPALSCLVLSGSQEVALVHDALAAGAQGYLVKLHPDELLQAIRLVLNGKIYLSPQLAKRLTEGDYV